MAKKIVAVNASPRKGWNTDTLVTEAAKGAEAAGAEIIKFDLYRLGKFFSTIVPSVTPDYIYLYPDGNAGTSSHRAEFYKTFIRFSIFLKRPMQNESHWSYSLNGGGAWI